MIVKGNNPDLPRENDGALRLTFKQLESIKFELIDVGLNNEVPDLHSNSITELNGYAECSSNTTPQLSIGLDWSFINGQYQFIGHPFVNFILQDQNGKDLNNQRNLDQIRKFVEQQNWNKLLIDKLNSSYQ